MNANFEKLIQRSGGYCLPWLIHLHDADDVYNFYFVNNNANITYDNIEYLASTFEYSANNDVCGFNGGGVLNITAIDSVGAVTNVVDMIRRKREMKLEVIGAIVDDEVSEIKKFQHHYGKVNIKNNVIKFTFDADDRTQMTFPALIWNNSNNRG